VPHHALYASHTMQYMTELAVPQNTGNTMCTSWTVIRCCMHDPQHGTPHDLLPHLPQYPAAFKVLKAEGSRPAHSHTPSRCCC
jgi:hypothetical protein